MVDGLTPERRSWNMSRIRGRDTLPERAVRSMLHRLGYRFRIHARALPGRPDIVLRRYCTVIFVHGCFWHRHVNCRFSYTPKTNVEKWTRKFAANILRDSGVATQLRQSGWRVITVWECEVSRLDLLSTRLRNELALGALQNSRGCR